MTKNDIESMANIIAEVATLRAKLVASEKANELLKTQLQNTIHNSDYSKCLDSFEGELYKGNKVTWNRGEVLDLLHKHFA